MTNHKKKFSSNRAIYVDKQKKTYGVKGFFKFLLTLIFLATLALVIYLLTGDVEEKKKRKKENVSSLEVEQILVKELQSILQAEEKLNKNKDLVVPDKSKQTTSNDTLNKKDNKSTIALNQPKQIIEQSPTLKETIKLKNIKKEAIISSPSSKPKLAIIFDDVSFSSDLRSIHKLKFVSTPSFFPPTPRHPRTPFLAKKEKIYMVHLPLEALNYPKEEDDTLYVNDSYARINQRLKSIKRNFPRLKYINNHTGSKFTKDYRAMDYLIKSFVNNDFVFIDSRTISRTKTKELAKKYGMRFMQRNIFLDHKANVAYIRNQLRKAVYHAKKYGRAIAIGHPRRHTLEALSDVADILKDVECVTIDKI
jgi:polysaccharide deacetylase 2 family uncharacterized protein YibQ